MANTVKNSKYQRRINRYSRLSRYGMSGLQNHAVFLGVDRKYLEKLPKVILATIAVNSDWRRNG